MILTITLNPAVDKTIEVDNFKLGSVNRVSKLRLDAGGKGINVSKVIKNLNGQSTAFGVLAGRAGKFIEEYLNSQQIINNFIFVEGETRTNVKVVDKVNHTNTDINEPGNNVSEDELKDLENRIFNTLRRDDILVLSGSIPKSVRKDIYGRWVEKAKEIGAKTILDADGEMLELGIAKGPYLIKPNIHELEMLFDKKINGVNEVIDSCRGLFEFGISLIAVSLGGDGAIFMNKEKAIYAHGMKVDVKSTVGAGDSMVAGLAFALDNGCSFEKAVTLSVASATAAVMTEGTNSGTLEDILKIEKEVVIETIEMK